jgi:ribose 5-phosphate isomerase B
MAANKWPDVRAALCWDVDIVRLSRAHNNANVLCLPARFISVEDAIDMVSTFMETEFEGGRHVKRVDGIKRS